MIYMLHVYFEFTTRKSVKYYSMHLHNDYSYNTLLTKAFFIHFRDVINEAVLHHFAQRDENVSV